MNHRLKRVALNEKGFEMNAKVSAKTAAAIALFAGAAIALTGCTTAQEQVVPSHVEGGGGSLNTAAPTASAAPIEDRTDVETGVVDGFAAWGVDRSAVDMTAVADVFGEEVTETAVSTALVRLMEGYSGDSLMVAHEQSLEDMAWAAMSEYATADFMATREVIDQALIPSTSPEGTFTAEDGVTYNFESWDCAMNTIPTTSITPNADIEVRSIIECAITTTQGVDFAYTSDVALRMIPSGDTAIINSIGYTSTLEAK